MIDQGDVKLKLVTATGWIDELPALGEDMKFVISGYAYRLTREHLQDRGEREEVTMKVTSIEPL